eukprot:456560_1
MLNYLIKHWPCRSVAKMRIFTTEIHIVFGCFIQFGNKCNWRNEKDIKRLSNILLDLCKIALYKLFIPMCDSESDELREFSHMFWSNETVIALLDKLCDKDKNDILDKIKHIPKVENSNTTIDFPVSLHSILENDTDI